MRNPLTGALADRTWSPRHSRTRRACGRRPVLQQQHWVSPRLSELPSLLPQSRLSAREQGPLGSKAWMVHMANELADIEPLLLVGEGFREDVRGHAVGFPVLQLE